MKQLIITILLVAFIIDGVIAQITSAQNKANFGVDAEVRASSAEQD